MLFILIGTKTHQATLQAQKQNGCYVCDLQVEFHNNINNNNNFAQVANNMLTSVIHSGGIVTGQPLQCI